MSGISKVLFLVVACCLTGCSAPPPRFGVEHNAIRKGRGLPLIQLSWTIYQSLDTETHWASGYKFDGSSGHAGKKVFYQKNGPITGEEDYYYSGKIFQPAWDPDAGTISEELIISYDCAKSNAPWTCTHCNTNGLTKVTLNEAEDMLHSWGLERITYETAAK